MNGNFRKIATASIDLNRQQRAMTEIHLKLMGEMLGYLTERKPATFEQIQAWQALKDASLQRSSELSATIVTLDQSLISAEGNSLDEP